MFWRYWLTLSKGHRHQETQHEDLKSQHDILLKLLEFSWSSSALMKKVQVTGYQARSDATATSWWKLLPLHSCRVGDRSRSFFKVWGIGSAHQSSPSLLAIGQCRATSGSPIQLSKKRWVHVAVGEDADTNTLKLKRCWLEVVFLILQTTALAYLKPNFS